MEIFLDVIKNKYAKFDGRARRKEYWYFVLFSYIAFIIFSYIIHLIFYWPLLYVDYKVSSKLIWVRYILYFCFAICLFLPTLAVFIRRMHDIDKSGWYILISLIPIIGGIILLVFLCTEGTKGQNKYGEDPKATNEIDQLGQNDLV